MSYTETKVIEMDKGKKVGDPLIQGAYSVPYDDNNSVGDELDRINEYLSDILNVLHPIGSIYMSVDNTNPSTLFGGTWVAWGSGRVPVGVNTSDADFDTVEETGGSKSETYTPAGTNGNVGSTTLTAAQSGVPAHSHGLNNHTHSYTDYYANGLSGSTTLTVDQIPSHTHSYTSVGSGQMTNSYQADVNVALSVGRVAMDTGSKGGGQGHTHSISNTSSSRTTGGNTGSTSNNTAANASQGHTHSGSTFTGTTATIGHVQPYITCYMWKRTA